MIPADFRVAIASGIPAALGQARTSRPTWASLAARLTAPPPRGSETMAEFAAMPKPEREARKAAPWYVGGASVDGGRTGSSFPRRSLLTLDIDQATPAFVARLLRGNGTEYAMHTTRSSTPEAPRLRLILPLPEEIEAERHALAVAGMKARIETSNPGVVVDPCSRDANRLLYAPTLCRDAPHVAHWSCGAFVDVAALVAAAPPPAPPVARGAGDLGGRVRDWRAVLAELGASVEPSPRRRGEFTTLCVWHRETHPSLDITPEGRMICRSCGRGGTILSYVMAALGCDAREAGRFLRDCGA